jgi:hypothetical protein
MPERDPLEILVEDFFDAVQRYGGPIQAFKSADTPIQPPLIEAEIRKDQEEKAQRDFEEKILEETLLPAEVCLGNTSDLSITVLTVINTARKDIDIDRISEEDRKRWARTSITSLSVTASNKLESLTVQLENLRPQTEEHELIKSLILAWGRRVEILRAAANIRE